MCINFLGANPKHMPPIKAMPTYKGPYMTMCIHGNPRCTSADRRSQRHLVMQQFKVLRWRPPSIWLSWESKQSWIVHYS